MGIKLQFRNVGNKKIQSKTLGLISRFLRDMGIGTHPIVFTMVTPAYAEVPCTMEVARKLTRSDGPLPHKKEGEEYFWEFEKEIIAVSWAENKEGKE